MKLRTLPGPSGHSAQAILTGSIAALAVFSANPASANNTWDGGGGGGFLWSNNVNWGGDTAPGYGTLNFSGAVGNTNVMDANYAMNQVQWNGGSAWVLNNSGGSVLSLFDNGGTQAKLESLGTGGVTINAPVTFAATAGNNWGEINAVSSSLTFGSAGTLNVTGSQVAGIRMFGGSGAIATTFNNTVSASGKYFSTSAVGQMVNLGGSFTAANFYLMNTGTLNLNAGGNLNGTAVRLGGDFGTTGTQDLTRAATFNLTPATGGLTFAGIVNSVSGNTSGALVVNSQNTSGTNTLSNQIALDSALKITQAAGGTLAITQVKGGDNTTGTDIKSNLLTFTPAATGAINHSGTIYNSTGSGSVTLNGAGTLTLSGANTYTGQTTVSSGILKVDNNGSTTAGKITGSSAAGSITVNSTGTLLLAGTGSADRIGNTTGVTLAGGTLSLQGLSGSSETMGLLTLSANSTLDFGTGNTNTLTFSGLSLGSFALTVSHWSGSFYTAGETTDHGPASQDRLLFGTLSLTGAQLAQISFYNDAGAFIGTGAQVSFGGTPELVPVPEPTTILGALALVGLVGWRERRRFLGKAG